MDIDELDQETTQVNTISGDVESPLFDVVKINSIVDKAVKAAVNELKIGLTAIINERLSKIEERVTEVEMTLVNVGSDVDSFHERFEKIESSIKINDEEVMLLKNKINNLEQYTRKSHLRVFGVKETAGESCIELVNKIIKERLKIDQPISIDAAHRVGPKSKTNQAVVGQVHPTPIHHRGIIVRFMRRDERQLVLSNRKKLKQSGISISEDMTQVNVKLLAAVQKHPLVKSAWFSNGKVRAEGHNGKTCRVELYPDMDDQLIKYLSD